MSDKQIQQMNDIIAERKRACAYKLADVFIDEHLNKEELASKSWADIILTTYKLVYKREKDDRFIYDIPRADAIATNTLVIEATRGLPGFDSQPGLFEFYQNTLGPARGVALDLMNAEATIGRGESYAILPVGTPWNNGKPVGLENITRCAVEICAVSDNPQAHKINDVLICRPTYAVIMRAVPELPKPMLDWAKRMNIKVH